MANVYMYMYVQAVVLSSDSCYQQSIIGSTLLLMLPLLAVAPGNWGCCGHLHGLENENSFFIMMSLTLVMITITLTSLLPTGSELYSTTTCTMYLDTHYHSKVGTGHSSSVYCREQYITHPGAGSRL